MIAVEILTEIAQLEALRSEWDALFARCEGATPFQRAAWVIAWCRHFECRAIWTLAVRRDGVLIGVAPWLIYTRASRRVVAFLAGGVSDYHDVLAEPAFADEIASALFECLAAHRDAWDECDFEQLGPRSFWRGRPAPSSLRENVTEQERCLRLALSRPLAPLAEIVPAHQLARLGKYRRRAERRAKLELSERDPHEGLYTLFRLHQARWASRGLDGVLADPRVRAFHGEILGAPGPSRARIYCLELGGAPIAALYALMTARTFYCYLHGFDPAYAEMSPGVLLVGGALEAARSLGAIEIDLLRGDAAYKAAWGGRGEPNVRRRLEA